MPRALWPLIALLCLAACSAPPLPAGVPGVSSGAGAAASATARAAATTGTDPDRLCQLAVPAAFAEDTPGSGYFPARDRTGFVAIDAPDRAGGANTFDQALATVLVNLKALLPGYVETAAIRGQGSLRVEFTAAPDGRAGRGVAYFRDRGPFVCGGTLFLTADSPLPFDSTLQSLIATLDVVKRAKPRPTATPLPPTPTPAPPAARDYRGAPLPPGSVFLAEEGQAATFLSPFDSEAETGAWLDERWTAAGMRYFTERTEQGYTFRAYRHGDRVVLFTTEKVSNLIGFTVVVTK